MNLEQLLAEATKFRGDRRQEGATRLLVGDLYFRLELVVEAMRSLVEQGANEDTGYYKDRGHRVKRALRAVELPQV